MRVTAEPITAESVGMKRVGGFHFGVTLSTFFLPLRAGFIHIHHSLNHITYAAAIVCYCVRACVRAPV